MYLCNNLSNPKHPRLTMAKFFVFALVIFGCAGVLSTPVSGRQPTFIWWPKDDNSGGYVPAFLHSSPRAPIIAAPYDEIKFYLYTQSVNRPIEIILNNQASLIGSSFDFAAPVKILVHGFSSSSSGGSAGHLTTSFLSNKHVNVISVDWSSLAAAPWYETAAGHTRTVGGKLAELIRFLVREGVPLSQVHLLGHSLGAHVIGFTGAFMASTLPRLTALDPALPLFGERDDSERIDPTDAVFVDCIHTAGGGLLEGGLAFRDPRGHIDFYPNQGERQPGCGADAFGSCSHSRAYQYYGESLSNNHGFRSCKCESWEHYLAGCACTETESMGEATTLGSSGLYYLVTNPQAPWALG